jgi:hypothetical protein
MRLIRQSSTVIRQSLVPRSWDYISRPTPHASRLLWLLLISVSFSAAPSTVLAEGAPHKKMDCRVYETKTTSFGMGLRFGAMLLPLVGPFVSATPMAGFDQKTGVTWDKAVHGLIARYVELCNRYNAGLVEKAEYETRLHEIEGLYKEGQGLEPKLFEATRSHAQEAAAELSQELGRKKTSQVETVAAGRQLADSVQTFAEQVERLEPAGRPLDPSGTTAMPPDPMKPPATTGTVGAMPDTSIRQP